MQISQGMNNEDKEGLASEIPENVIEKDFENEFKPTKGIDGSKRICFKLIQLLRNK
jgi:hypothetical protein